MKKTFTLIALIITLITFAQAPQGFNYQATVRNAAGTLIVNQNVYFRFNIMLNSQTSVPVFSETHYVPTDDLGQVNIIVGTGTATTGTFSTIDWGTGNYYLGIELNIGNGYVAMGTTQLLSVPYALYSNRSGNSNFNFPNGTNIGDTLNWIWNGSAWVPTSSVSTAQLPVISTTVATNILTPTPSSGGTITSDGGFSITSKGVCWSSNPNPTINDNTTNNGTGASNFTSILSNLLPTTTYYYRAYATNSIGTSYGITYTFTTLAIPQLTTTPINYITYGTVAYPHSGGTISNDGGAQITSKGVVWSTSPNPTVTTNQGTYEGGGNGAFTSCICPYYNRLLPGTLYYVRAYATNSYGTAYGQEEVFTTLAILPTLYTTTTSEITSTTAISGGTIFSDGGASITDKGIVWSTSPNPTITTNQGISSEGTGIDAFSSTITQLTPGTVYYVRSYSTNTIGTVYGQEEVFTTLAILPNLTTKLVSNITSTTAISGGNNTYDGGDYIMIKGIVWNTTPNPTTTSNQGITYEGEDNGAFTSALNQLLPNTLYYVRAYATNSIGTAYGQEEVFTTLVGVPILATTAAAEITITTARSGGSISNDGGVPIINKGMVWSTSPNPTVITNEGITSDGSGMDTFTSTITQLTPGTLYYVRAYSTNSIGTGYGQEVVFTTLSTLPTLTTTLVSDITSYTAYSGGIITNDGGDYIIDKGIVWSTNPNPTTTTNIGITYDGQGIDAFTSIINQLLPGTLYYVRAYATNTIGTAYGQEEVFTTLVILPTLTTTLVSDMTSTTASSGGTILNDGGTSIIDKGIVWSTTTDPTITLNEGITSEGNGIDAFTSTITQLIPGTLYYLRAYATNSIGTAYGQE